ncbi:aldehyde dehydrogenase [[Clostridium] innocuum]|nr:aldehyde dehydrogenase [[Clostridium] innocuum]
MEIKALVTKQRNYFRTQATKDINTRRQALKRLKAALREMEAEIHEALRKDLNKSDMEAYMSETGMVLSELTYQLRHMEQWARPKRVRTPLAQFSAKSWTQSEPYGVVLVMAPWNYPFQLALEPAIGAIAAGNTVIIKPSAYASATSAVIAKLIQHCFSKEYVAVVEGGRKENTELLEQRFDYIFFTGGVEVGRLVMSKASRYLTPVTLELGGKSPCIIDKTADLKLAARRIAFGKFLNAGQTCVAPDYVYVEECVKHEFLAYLQDSLYTFFQGEALRSDSYPSIVNEKHFKRLSALLQNGSVCIGGRTCEETLQIEPTVLEDITWQHPIMQEEIFGPLLPVLTFTSLDEVIQILLDKEKPLALYLFTKNKKAEHKVLSTLSFGGGCINDTIIHLATSAMGFGGVGQSGMGSYHGRESFKTFSHNKSIVKKANWIDLPFRYHPYTKCKDRLVRMFLK